MSASGDINLREQRGGLLGHIDLLRREEVSSECNGNEYGLPPNAVRSTEGAPQNCADCDGSTRKTCDNVRADCEF
jgi:hypothetical protein